MAEPEADAQYFYSHTGYTAYPYGYHHYPYNYGYHYGKREAEAEPEADPALIYTTNTLPLTTAVHHSPLVSPLVSTGVHQPIVYNSPIQTPVVYKTLPVAEKTEKVSTPVVYTHALPLHKPLVYNSAVQTPLVYNVQAAVHSPLLKTVDNAVVPTLGGYIHSSHVGVCTNNLGVRVPC